MVRKHALQIEAAAKVEDRQVAMTADLELLWRLYDDHQHMVRHHDGQRATFTQYILILAAGATGVAKLGEFAPIVNFVLAGFVICVGCVGMWTTRRLSRACATEKGCGNAYLCELRARVPSLAPDAGHPDSGRGPWQVLNFLVVLLGLAILACTYAHVLGAS